MSRRYRWQPYVSVAERRAQACAKMNKLRKKGIDVKPIEIEGRKITRTFWGQAWCDHLEQFSDYANRLPRGRTYVRNGSVCHLEIHPGKVKAMVSGSRLYNVEITIKKLPSKKWRELKERCGGQITSLLELLQGTLSKSVMEIVTDREKGLFPLPREIELNCSCPDWATMCKHVAAVLYGVGARLDTQPELLFLLREVDHEELISVGAEGLAETATGSGRKKVAAGDLSEVFGIEIDETPAKIKSVSKLPAKVTGATVVKLRTRLGLSKSALALLLGVSAATVSNWEKKKGTLKLQDRSRAALSDAVKLNKTSARKQLEN